jgi:uncharacterized membrane protein YfcA
MDIVSVSTISVIAFVICIISVSTGGTSLITVPVLIWLGFGPKEAIATNMFALLFLSISGAIGFRKQLRSDHYKMIAVFSVLTIAGSLIGARIVLEIDQQILQRIIGIIICCVAALLFTGRGLGIEQKSDSVSKLRFLSGVLLIFVLGIYGGFFSGGYVTLLTYVLIVCLGFSFLQVAFITKVFNIFSSLAACLFFYYNDLIDFSVGIPLAIAMFAGAALGAKLAISQGNLWVRRVFIAAVLIMAVKLLLF